MCKIRFLSSFKEQEANALLGNLGSKTPLNKILLLVDISFLRYKMNKIVNRFLLAGDKFMVEVQLTQPVFMYKASGQFSKIEE